MATKEVGGEARAEDFAAAHAALASVGLSPSCNRTGTPAVPHSTRCKAVAQMRREGIALALPEARRVRDQIKAEADNCQTYRACVLRDPTGGTTKPE